MLLKTLGITPRSYLTHAVREEENFSSIELFPGT